MFHDLSIFTGGEPSRQATGGGRGGGQRLAPTEFQQLRRTSGHSVIYGQLVGWKGGEAEGGEGGGGERGGGVRGGGERGSLEESDMHTHGGEGGGGSLIFIFHCGSWRWWQRFSALSCKHPCLMVSNKLIFKI